MLSECNLSQISKKELQSAFDKVEDKFEGSSSSSDEEFNMREEDQITIDPSQMGSITGSNPFEQINTMKNDLDLIEQMVNIQKNEAQGKSEQRK